MDTSNLEQFNDLVKSTNRGIVYFWAPWCEPCKYQSPIVETICEEMGIDLIKVNTDEDGSQEILRPYNVVGIPTLIYIEDGVEVNRQSSASTKEMIIQAMGIKGPNAWNKPTGC